MDHLNPLEKNGHDARLKDILLYLGRSDIKPGCDGCSLLKSEFIAIETRYWECVDCWITGFPA